MFIDPSVMGTFSWLYREFSLQEKKVSNMCSNNEIINCALAMETKYIIMMMQFILFYL